MKINDGFDDRIHAGPYIYRPACFVMLLIVSPSVCMLRKRVNKACLIGYIPHFAHVQLRLVQPPHHSHMLHAAQQMMTRVS
jgi:hypothetical protein